MALFFSIAECGILSTMMGSSKKQTSSCNGSAHILSCVERINLLVNNPNSADRDDACSDCRPDLEDFADRCLDNTDAQVIYDWLEGTCGSRSGAVVIGMPLFSVILAVLVAVASAMD